MTTTASSNQARRFTLRELIDELIRRVGPDEAQRLIFDECPSLGIATIEDLLNRADVAQIEATL